MLHIKLTTEEMQENTEVRYKGRPRHPFLHLPQVQDTEWECTAMQHFHEWIPEDDLDADGSRGQGRDKDDMHDIMAQYSKTGSVWRQMARWALKDRGISPSPPGGEVAAAEQKDEDGASIVSELSDPGQ